MLKGAIHVHSTYSDGEFLLSELREIFVSAGCSFVCMTDHAEYFDAQKLEAYKSECRELSNDKFQFIPGIEYTCRERMHVLAYGVTSPVATTDPQEVIRHIRSENGVAVIAHPMDSAFEWIESFETLPDGIEAWNTKYDGRFAPRPATFALLNRLQKRSPAMRASYGIDLHWKKQYRGLFNVVESEELAPEKIIAAMGRGDYFASKGELVMPSSGQLAQSLLRDFDRIQKRYARKRQMIKKTKRLIDRFGFTLPAPLKAQLRRIF
jgi:predicted metal-dependent phosphoesterase TrpH